MPTCPTCQSSTCVKAGRVRKKQRYKCKTCGYFFTDPATHARGYSASLKQQALAMVLDGNGIRQAARHTGVSHVSILNWIKQAAQATQTPSIEKADVIEIDEMWHYVQKNNKRWIWIAICRSSKRIVGFVIGTRGKKTGNKLWQQIKHITCQQYYTDYWQAYQGFLPTDKHKASKKETYTIEGYNNLIRHYLARFNRRTHCYSKSEYMLSCLLTLFFHKLNIKYT